MCSSCLRATTSTVHSVYTPLVCPHVGQVTSDENASPAHILHFALHHCPSLASSRRCTKSLRCTDIFGSCPSCRWREKRWASRIMISAVKKKLMIWPPAGNLALVPKLSSNSTRLLTRSSRLFRSFLLGLFDPAQYHSHQFIQRRARSGSHKQDRKYL